MSTTVNTVSSIMSDKAKTVNNKISFERPKAPSSLGGIRTGGERGIWSEDDEEDAWKATAWYQKDGDAIEGESHLTWAYEGNKAIAGFILQRLGKQLAKAKDYKGLQAAIRRIGQQWHDAGLEFDLEPLAFALDSQVEMDANLWWHLQDVKDAPEASFKADLELNSRYLTIVPDAPRVVAIKSPKNTGKTTWLRSVLPAKGAIVNVGHRLTLLRAMAKATGLTFFEDSQQLNEETRVAITLDSLYKLSSGATGHGRLKGCTLVLDEVSQLFSHLLGDTLQGHKRTNAIVSLLWLCQNAAKVIAMDADFTQADVAFLGTLTGDKVYALHNTYQAKDRFFKAHPSYDSCLNQVLACLASAQKVVIAEDTREGAKDIRDLLTQHGYKVFIVTSDNAQSDQVKAFILDPTLVKGCDALIFSPSLSTGFDLNFPYFDTQFLFGSHLIASDLHQLAYRVRQISTKEVHCYIKQPRVEFPIKEVEQEMGCFLLDEDGYRVPVNEHIETLLGTLRTYKDEARLASLRDLALSFYSQAIKDGYEVETWQTEGEKQDRKALRQARKEAEVASILAAPEVTLVEDETPHESRVKYFASIALVKPQADLDAQDIAFYLKDKGKAASLYLDMHLPAHLDLLGSQDDAKNEGLLSIDHQDRKGTQKLMKEIMDTLKAAMGEGVLGWQMTQASLEVDLLPLLKKRKAALAKLLGVTLRPKQLTQTLSDIFKKNGWKLDSARVTTCPAVLGEVYKTEKSAGQLRPRVYTINPESYAYMEALRERALAFHQLWLMAQDTRFAERFDEDSAKTSSVSYDTLLQKALRNELALPQIHQF
jgi:hypothetical protein